MAWLKKNEVKLFALISSIFEFDESDREYLACFEWVLRKSRENLVNCIYHHRGGVFRLLIWLVKIF
jgi:phage gp29-like protein